MEKNIIGNIISTARKKKGFSQEELARNLFISRQAISSWENGKSLPDISIIYKLCKILDIDMNMILSNNSELNFISVIETEKNKIKKKLILVIILIIVFLFLNMYLFITINRNKFSVYKVVLDSNDFSLSNGILIKSRIDNYFQLGNLKTTLDNISIDNLVDITLYKIDGDNKMLIIEQTKDSNLIIQENYGYDEYFLSIDDNLDNYFIEVTFIKDNEFYTYNINIKFEQIITNNNLVYLKKDKINKLKLNEENSILEENNFFKNGYKLNNDEGITYNKKQENGEFIFNKNLNTLMFSNLTEYSDLNIEYQISNKIIIVSLYNKKEQFFENNFIYNLENNNLVCNSKECNEYQKYIDIIVNEYKLLISK